MSVDHSTLNRWVVKYAPALEKQLQQRKRPVGTSWRLDETYVRVKGEWKYLYRAVDKAGQTVDFLLMAHRNRATAPRFLRKAIQSQGRPEKITIDKSGANTAAIESDNSEQETTIEIRQCKYLNNLIEQDHRAVKRLTRPMLGFKSFWAVQHTLAGIEVMHMIHKGQLQRDGGEAQTPAEQFYALAAQITQSEYFARLYLKFATEPNYHTGAESKHLPVTNAGVIRPISCIARSTADTKRT